MLSYVPIVDSLITGLLALFFAKDDERNKVGGAGLAFNYLIELDWRIGHRLGRSPAVVLALTFEEPIFNLQHVSKRAAAMTRNLAMTFMLWQSTTPAIAQVQEPFCSSINVLKQQARSGFQAIDQGPSRPGATSHGTGLILPGASRCWISVRNANPSYLCTWNVPSQVLAAQAMQFGAAIAQCIGAVPEWERDSTSISTFLRDGSTEFYINAEDGEIDLSVELAD